MKRDFLAKKNLFVIGGAGLSFGEYLLSKNLLNFTCTAILKKEKHKPVGKKILGHNILWVENVSQLDFSKIARLRESGQRSLIVFSGAGEFSSDVAIKLNDAISLNTLPIINVVIGPFRFEGEERQKRADATYQKLVTLGSTCIRLSNQDIFSMISPQEASSVSFDEGFSRLNGEIIKVLETEKHSGEQT